MNCAILRKDDSTKVLIISIRYLHNEAGTIFLPQTYDYKDVPLFSKNTEQLTHCNIRNTRCLLNPPQTTPFDDG
jgi:hypothetical protein